MRTLLLAAVASLSMATLPVQAEPGQQTDVAAQGGRCLEWPMAMSAARMTSPDAQLVKEMDGNLASEFVRLVNSLPPVSSFDGNHVALFFKPRVEQFMADIGKDTCASHVVELPASVFAQMVGQPV